MVWFGLEGSESPTAILLMSITFIHSFILDTVVPFPTDIAGVAVNVIRRRTNWEKYISCQTHRSSRYVLNIATLQAKILFSNNIFKWFNMRFFSFGETSDEIVSKY